MADSHGNPGPIIISNLNSANNCVSLEKGLQTPEGAQPASAWIH